MPDLCVEKTDSSGEFQNFVMASRLVQKGILENASLLQTELVEYSTCHTQCTHNGAIVCTGRLAIVMRPAGESPSATSALFIAHWLL